MEVLNVALDDIKAQIIKHYQHLSDREAYVTAEMVRNAFQGIGNEYETLLGAFDKDNANFKLRCGKESIRTRLYHHRRCGFQGWYSYPNGINEQQKEKDGRTDKKPVTRLTSDDYV